MPRKRLERRKPRRLTADATFNRKCGRTSFKTEIDAKIAAGTLPAGRIIRKCPNCHGYHIIDADTTLESRRNERRKG